VTNKCDRGEALYFSRNTLRLKSDVPGAKMWAVSLRRTMLTYFEVEPNCRFESHRHRSEQITMVLAGELFFQMADRTECVRAGEVIAIPSFVEHAVFTRRKRTRAVDAWSPTLPKYRTR
jgi:mannose-6-phosphate isomerase-like protein (cupin superfamily)